MKKFIIMLIALLFATAGNPVLAKKQQKAELQKQKAEIKARKKLKNAVQPSQLKEQKTELQKQKAEIKAWKKQKNAMQPLQLKDLIEENHRLKTSNYKLAEEIKVSKENLEQLVELKKHVDSQNSKKKEREETSSQSDSHDHLAQRPIGPDGLSSNDWAVDKEGKFYIKGLIFKVQIGAYKKRDLSKVMEGEKPQEVFEQEQSKGVNMYTLRHFRNYWNANQFKKELRAMGLKDAWVVAFKDGKRVPLKEVLQKVINNKKDVVMNNKKDALQEGIKNKKDAL